MTNNKLPKAFHIKVDELTAEEQLDLLLRLFHFSNKLLAETKLTIEIEK